jgi:hypothetical protein
VIGSPYVKFVVLQKRSYELLASDTPKTKRARKTHFGELLLPIESKKVALTPKLFTPIVFAPKRPYDQMVMFAKIEEIKKTFLTHTESSVKNKKGPDLSFVPFSPPPHESISSIKISQIDPISQKTAKRYPRKNLKKVSCQKPSQMLTQHLCKVSSRSVK